MPSRRIRLAAPSVGHWLRAQARAAYLRFLIRSAEQDLVQLEAELASIPRRAAAHRKHIAQLRVELALTQP